ncbi:putative ATPase [Caulobacter ginsengisoli]|uniref:ATPase n=1 Tax=Caulobacter ginsengisoli TaxID=400775 RepID=A0ABU0IXK8_9CAUL|nr:putative ATPase [Caulobacter ginsengisoli]
MGYPVIEEAGRQVVREQALIGGPGLPDDIDHFLDLTISRTIYAMTMALAQNGPMIMDRCIVDQISDPGQPAWRLEAARRFAVNRTVFVTPPWPEIFATDTERRHGFVAAEAMYHQQMRTYRDLGYDLVHIPKSPVPDRIAFLLERLPPPGAKP